MTSWIALTLFLADDPPSGQSSTSLWKMIQAGGLVGYLLIALSIFALTMIIMHMVMIRRKVLLPPEQIEIIDSLLARGDVAGTLEYCLNPEYDSYLTRILSAGLTRFQRSAFGAFEIKNAVQDAGEEQTARLYRSTDVLSVIGSISPLLGLLGTVLGIVGAFDTLSKGVTPDQKTLAANISLALVTTLLGLVVAIPCMALFTYFRNRIDALAGEAGSEIERLLLHLESAQAVTPATPNRPTFVPRAPGRAEEWLKMRFTKRKSQRSDFELMVTSMLDINFLLIMFFMLTAHVQRETHARLNLPQEKGEKSLQSDEAGLVINIGPDGGIIVSGRSVALADLRSMVKAEIDKHAIDAADPIKLMVRADRNGTTQHLNNVVAMLRELGVGTVCIATEIPLQ